MIWTRRFWSAGLLAFFVSFFTGTHLGEWHLYVSVPSMVLIILALVRCFMDKNFSARARGTALTTFLFFVFSSLLGWSVFVDTLPGLMHGVLMGLTGLAALVLTYELFWPAEETA